MTASVAADTQTQGIVTFLGSVAERMEATSTTDMSSKKKWLAQNGFSPMDKTASSIFEIHSPDSSSSCEGGEDSCEVRMGQFFISASIQQNKNEGDKMIQVEEKQGQSAIWSSIICLKTNEDDTTKRSKRCLSVRSLEICTESLGSETGSDGFSSYPPSETGDAEDQDKEEQQKSESMVANSHVAAEEEFRSVTNYKYHAAASKKVTPITFPPPLPSLSRSDGAASLRMRSFRDNGRLVVEAVSVPSQKNFLAVRQDGRLVLTYVDDRKSEEPELDDGNEQEVECERMEEEFAGSESGNREKEHDEYEDDGAEEGWEVETKDIEKLSSDSMINVHRLALMIKSYELGNRNPPWSSKLNEVVRLKKAEKEEEDIDVVKRTSTPVAHSRPPWPTTTRTIPSSTAAAAAACFNDYEYYWRPKQTAKTKPQIFYDQECSIFHPRNNYDYSHTSIVTKNIQSHNGRQQLLVLRGEKGDYLIPMSKTCKESRVSALFWEPYCIVTS